MLPMSHGVEWWLGLWAHQPASVLGVMAAGIFAGSILKSITGFGSTIAHLCIWSVIKAFGVNAGTLPQAVATEVVFRTVTALPYLQMTDARNTANAKLVCSISLFQTVGSPLGAWLLTFMDKKSLELSLAAALGVVLLFQTVGAYLFNNTSIPAAAGKQGAAQDEMGVGPQSGDMREPLLKPFVEVLEPCSNCREGKLDHQSVDSEAGFTCGAVIYVEEPSEEEQSGVLNNPNNARQWAVLMASGSVAGTLSGVMGGLTGIDGPPTIFMFRMLKADKACIRGTNAVINCLLMAVLVTCYSITGTLTMKDFPLYLVGAVFGWVGTILGNRLAHMMSPTAFGQLLKGMVVVCACLMLAGGQGLTE